MNVRSRTFLAAFAAVLLAGAIVVFAASMLDGITRSSRRTPKESKPAEESRPAPATPHAPAAIGPEGEGPISARPSYAPDGRELAFWTLWRGGQSDIWVASTVNGRLRPLAADPAIWESDPAWSPTGSWVAFKSNRAGNHDIWLIRPDGSGLTQLTTDRALDDQPAWSPDGTQIAFVSNRAGSRNIWVINADGSGLRRVTNPPGNQNHPGFSPDGSQIVFSQSSYSPTGELELHLKIINANGIGLRQLTTGAFRDWNASWSAQGILFQTNRSGPYAIWMIQPNGSGLRAIPNAIGSEPTWSPDGAGFAFSRNNIYEFNFRNGTVRALEQLKGYFIAIEIMPRVSPKVINLRGTSPVQIAILSAPGFNPVLRIDQTTLTFGRTGEERSLAFCAADEVNGDGVPDLVCHFEIRSIGLRPGDSEGILRVMNLSRIRLEGRVAVQIVP